MRTYRVGVARHPAYGKTRGQIRERLLAVARRRYALPGLRQPHVPAPHLDLHHTMLGLHHTDAAGR